MLNMILIIVGSLMYISKPNTFNFPVSYIDRQTLGFGSLSTREVPLIGISFPSTTIPR